jgi:hypothetical protein
MFINVPQEPNQSLSKNTDEIRLHSVASLINSTRDATGESALANLESDSNSSCPRYGWSVLEVN